MSMQLESFDAFVEICVRAFRNPTVNSSAVWVSGVEYVESKELSTTLVLLVAQSWPLRASLAT